jgi:prolyl oligopeptidase
MIRKVPVFGLLVVTLAGLVPLFAREAPRPPTTMRKPVIDIYHGIQVTDDYRWLENAQDPQVRQWVKDQNHYTRSLLRKLPSWKPIQQRLQYLNEELTADYDQLTYQGGNLFALDDGVLVTIRLNGNAPPTTRELVDPEQKLPDKNATISAYFPSVDGSLVAVVMAVEGREEGSIYVYETATGKQLPDLLPNVFTSSGGSLVWQADGSGFYYTRHPRDARTPRKDRNAYSHVYFHKLGRPVSEDRYVWGKGFSRLTSITLASSRDGRHVIAQVNVGTAVETALYYLTPTGKWQQITGYADEITMMAFGRQNDLYLISEKGAPRGQVLRLSLNDPRIDQAQVILPQGDRVLQGVLPTAKGLYVVDNLGAGDRLRVLDRDGKAKAVIPLPPMSTVDQLISMESGVVLYRVESYRDPPAWFRYDPAVGQGTPTGLAVTSPVDFHNLEVVQEWAVSKDSTRVPVTIVYRKGTPRDGRNPTLVTGYGGYGDSQVPDFQVDRMVWFEQGGIFAVAHVRGGGELGADWRRAGQLIKKQNGIDDFAACLQLLIDRTYTCPQRLAITGASQGGALVGAALTQYPGKVRAMVGEVGAYDLLRSELHPNEAFSITEQGTVTDPEQFKALYAYSPYRRVVDGTAYPAVFLLTGENDNRVDPANSWKMAARLQAATTSHLPVLLWTGSKSGHDNGARGDIITRQTDIFAFLFQQLGVKYRPVPDPRKAQPPASAIGLMRQGLVVPRRSRQQTMRAGRENAWSEPEASAK